MPTRRYMTGIVIVTHGKLGAALIDTAEFIKAERLEGVAAVSIDLNEHADKLRKKIAVAIKTVDQKQGVLILTDMFGGTPSNLSYSFLEEGRIEVISGVNLPILIKALGWDMDAASAWPKVTGNKLLFYHDQDEMVDFEAASLYAGLAKAHPESFDPSQHAVKGLLVTRLQPGPFFHMYAVNKDPNFTHYLSRVVSLYQ